MQPDRGGADPQVVAALDTYGRGELPERDMLAVLRGSRMLVPIVAVAADGSSEKQTDMALPKLVGNDGREAVMAFTSVDTMRRWDPQARPVPMPAERACQAALSENCVLVVDVGGPVPVALEGARLSAIAGGEPVPPPHEDPEVRSIVERIDPGAVLVPADGKDMVVELTSAAPARDIALALRHRLRAIEFRARA